MRTKASKLIIVLITVMAVTFFSCSSDDTVSVTINLNLQALTKNLPVKGDKIGRASIIDRILRFFTIDAKAQTIPSGVSSFTVTVSGANMITINQSFPASTGSVTIDVPAGTARLFTVTANISATDPGPILAFEGTTTSDLNSGESVTLTINLGVSRTKILIPDSFNNRIVQIDDMTGTGFQTRTRTDINYLSATIFRPSDIDIDNLGNIYIVNDTPESAGAYIILRIDNMAATTFTPIINGNATGLNAIAIDRVNNNLYYGFSNSLSKVDLDTQCASFPCTSTPLDTLTASISNILGIAVDDSGFLYIACNVVGAGNVILKYDPAGAGVALINFPIATGTPWDVLYKAPYIYAAIFGGAANNQIIRLNTDLTGAVGYGVDVNATSNAPGDFYGPRRFVAILNREIVIIDDNDTSANLDKLVSIDDILGTGWTTFGSQGALINQFNFFDFC